MGYVGECFLAGRGNFLESCCHGEAARQLAECQEVAAQSQEIFHHHCTLNLFANCDTMRMISWSLWKIAMSSSHHPAFNNNLKY